MALKGSYVQPYMKEFIDLFVQGKVPIALDANSEYQKNKYPERD